MIKKQVIKRLVQILTVLFGISFLTFGLTYLAPGDPVRAMYAASGAIPGEEILERTREALGLNEPFLVQYANTPVRIFGIGALYGKGKIS